jgi:acetyltransferase-like isoleucine patch superfamily enzyme
MQTRFSIGKTRFSSEAEVLSSRGVNSVRIGDHGHIRGELFVFPHAGRIEIGDWVYVGVRTSIWSASLDGVRIGDRVLIASDVVIHDTNGHPLDAPARFEQTVAILSRGHPDDIETIESQGIVIENDAWIGTKATILKGVTVGEGAVVGACSVVTRDVEPFTVVAGNPARVVKRLDAAPSATA